MVLEYKELTFRSVDGLLKSNHDLLKTINGRTEVPVLIDDDVVVVNSSDIVAYLDDRYPQRSIYPADPAIRVRARAWERAADTFLDAILINVSYWKWATRKDAMPRGLLEAALADIELTYERLDHDLARSEFVCGAFSIGDIALFPHLSGVTTLGLPYSSTKHANILRWHDQMRSLPVCRADIQRARDYFGCLREMDIETERIFWRGDRIEWMLAHGFGDWFFGEVAAGRVLWPGASLPLSLP